MDYCPVRVGQVVVSGGVSSELVGNESQYFVVVIEGGGRGQMGEFKVGWARGEGLRGGREGWEEGRGRRREGGTRVSDGQETAWPGTEGDGRGGGAVVGGGAVGWTCKGGEGGDGRARRGGWSGGAAGGGEPRGRFGSIGVMGLEDWGRGWRLGKGGMSGGDAGGGDTAGRSEVRT
ncbi:hypothetical protein Tco_0816801 [Tanacetum coccineum]